VDTWLSEQYHVIIPDLPGYGLSDIYRGSYTADVYLRFVESFLERACGPMSRVCACGLSSSAVLRIAARRPHLISKLALVSPVSTAHGRQNPLHSVAAPLFGASGLTAASVQRNLSASAILQTVSANLYAPGSPLAEEAVPLRHWVANRPFASYVEASRLSGLMNADIRQPLRAAHQPLLVLTGAYAPKPVLDEAESVAQLAANGSYFAFRESSASPHEEEPESFCRTLTGFFESDAFAHVA
jgi:pimeloyl-ACP methyl ester carboxylesterase